MPAPPVPRLLEALRARGHAVSSDPLERLEDSDAPVTVVFGPGEPPARVPAVSARVRAAGARVRLLVMSLLGTHPDARAPVLQRSWSLEEQARATALPLLVLRLAPLIGPGSPLWLRLGRVSRLPRAARRLLMPVLESDVLETLERALSGRAAWEGWYEVAGPEPLTLAELAACARAAARAAGEAGDWEPPLEVLEEQRLCDPDPWRRHFGLEPGSPLAWAREQAA
jgi:hypothetical protein